jgi:hypothetical protein
MIVLLRKRIMTSWANMNQVSLKKKEPTIRSYFSSSEDYATSSLQFLYSFIYSQRSAEPFYIYDTHGYFQPLLKTSPILHFTKTMPVNATDLTKEMFQMSTVLNSMNLTTLKRIVSSVFQYNGETLFKIESFLRNFGLLQQTFDVGIVLDISGCVPSINAGLLKLQKRIGKKSLHVFVMTDDMELLRQFAMTGDSSWTYKSMMRYESPTDKQYALFKTLGELKLMQKADYLVCRLGSPLGKLLFLTSEKVNTESQVVSVDGQGWKAM